jgi:hypothetical protein
MQVKTLILCNFIFILDIKFKKMRLAFLVKNIFIKQTIFKLFLFKIFFY